MINGADSLKNADESKPNRSHYYEQLAWLKGEHLETVYCLLQSNPVGAGFTGQTACLDRQQRRYYSPLRCVV
jgi:hypothetical protein